MKLLTLTVLVLSLLAQEQSITPTAITPRDAVSLVDVIFEDTDTVCDSIPVQNARETTKGNLIFVGCTVLAATAKIVNDRWIITIQPGYSLLDLFRIMDEYPRFPLAKTLAVKMERRTRLPATKIDPQVIYLEKK